jgi:hypothetical protein
MVIEHNAYYQTLAETQLSDIANGAPGITPKRPSTTNVLQRPSDCMANC